MAKAVGFKGLSWLIQQETSAPTPQNENPTWVALKQLYDEQAQITAEGYAPMPGMDWLESIAKILEETRNGS